VFQDDTGCSPGVREFPRIYKATHNFRHQKGDLKGAQNGDPIKPTSGTKDLLVLANWHQGHENCWIYRKNCENVSY